MSDLKYIEELFLSQKNFFLTQKNFSVDYRIEQLKKLQLSIKKHEEDIYEALWKDLHKCREEVFMTEYNIVLTEISLHIKNLRKWSKNKTVKTPLFLKPSKSYIMYEPYGVALIIAPWNYPINLSFCPLIAAISAGCCAVLKTSPYSVHSSAIMQKIIDECFDPCYIAMVQGHREVNTKLLEQHFDFIFYTGSPEVGKIVMAAAAKHLCPVVLELGGKSPCIVDKNANLEFAARRIVWGKTINAGQTCVAPDYLMVHESIKDELIKKMQLCYENFYGQNSKESSRFCRIINDKAFQRIISYINSGKVIYGGNYDANERYIQFTLLDNANENDAVMQDEIFGPVMPVLTFKNIDEVVNFVNQREKPLAFYYFGNNSEAKNILNRSTSGGVCLNDTLLHVSNDYLPFGGVGNSGIGKYHGKESFLAFSNRRAVLKSSNKIDMKIKYPPYSKFSIIKKMM